MAGAIRSRHGGGSGQRRKTQTQGIGVMEDRLFVYHDCAYLSELALSSDLFDALLFVYQSADGPTGLDLNDAGRSLLKVFLSPSISISSTGRVSVYDPSSAATSFFSAVMANKEIAIHGPDDVLLAEAATLAEYQKQVTIAATAARLGKKQGAPSSAFATWIVWHADGKQCHATVAIDALFGHFHLEPFYVIRYTSNCSHGEWRRLIGFYSECVPKLGGCPLRGIDRG
jgi:hypothetical protein